MAQMNLANGNPTIGNPLITYSITPIYGDKEDVKTLTHFKDAVLQYLSDVATKEAVPHFLDFPERWKFLLKKWVMQPSRALDLLDRPDYETPTKFCDSLISRKKSKSEKFSDELRNFLIALSKPQSMDRHAKTIREFSEDFFVKFFSDKLMIALSASFDMNFLPVTTNNTFTRAANLVDLFTTAREAYLFASIEVMKKEFLTSFHRHFMMAMVAADTKLFAFLESNQLPLVADPSDFTDWIQEKILDPENSTIFLTLANQSPLVKVNRTSPAATGNVQSTFRTPNNNSPTTTARTTPNNPPVAPNQKGKGKTSAPSVGGGPPTKTQKGSSGATPNAGGHATAKRHCVFCFDNFKNSTSYTKHDDNWCFRNPLSPRYDAAKAAVPPTK